MTLSGRPIAIVGLTLVLLAPVSVSPQTLDIEAEDYTTSHNIAGLAIQAIPGSGCSGGYLIVGLDYPGEWAEYDVAVTDFGYYSLEIKCRGDFNYNYALRLIFTPAETGTEQIVDFSFTGTGYG